MGLFERLERALERLVEGRLMGGFRGRVHPIEIARRVGQQMQAERRIGVSRTYVPNVFHVGLHPLDFEPLAPIEREVEEEIVSYLRRQVRERDYSLAGRIRVVLEEHEGQAAGDFAVSARFERDDGEAVVTSGEVARPDLPPPPMKAQSAGAPSPPTDTARTEAGARALLLGKSGFVEGKVIPLRDDVAIIGRSPDCAVHVPDGQVSKVHARLDWTGTTYRLTSLGKNGTTVNGTAVEAPRPLAHGDDIALGASSLHFRLFA